MLKTKEFFRTLHHKKIIRFIVYTFLILCFPFIGIYIHFIEPRWIQITRLRIKIKKLHSSFDGFRIVQISDIHFGPTHHNISFLKKCIDRVNNQKPDIIVITGDFLQWDASYMKGLAFILSSLKARIKTYAILGNHDYGVCHSNQKPHDPIDYQHVIKILSSKGIRVLHNEIDVIHIKNHNIQIIGLGDYWTPYFQPNQVFTVFNKQHPTLLLSHNPDSIEDLKQYDFDLMLAGHAHGGQISFPFIGPITVPVKYRKFRRGLHRIENKWLYTNRGLGYTFKARLLSRPEITCIDLESTATRRI